jgi:DNA-binding MarR family transcriptional regulator
VASKSSGGAVDLPGFFADLVRSETRIYTSLNDRLRERHGIVTSQFEALRFLRRRPGARVADLSAEFAIGIGASSKIVDRLERQGWVVRRPNPADRRSSLVDLTEDGARLADAAEATFAARLAELVGEALAGEAGEAAARVMAELRASLERDQVGLPAG